MKRGEREAINKVAHLSSVVAEISARNSELEGILAEIVEAKKKRDSIEIRLDLLQTREDELRATSRKCEDERILLNSEKARFVSEREEFASRCETVRNSIQREREESTMLSRGARLDIEFAKKSFSDAEKQVQELIKKGFGLSLEVKNLDSKKRESERELSLLEEKQKDEIAKYDKSVLDKKRELQKLNEEISEKIASVSNFKKDLLKKEDELRERERDLIILEGRLRRKIEGVKMSRKGKTYYDEVQK